MLVIQFGKNDLVESSAVEHLSKIVKELGYSQRVLPKAWLVWIKMFSRRVWMGALDAGTTGIARRKVKKQMAWIFKWHHGTTISRPGISCYGTLNIIKSGEIHSSMKEGTSLGQTWPPLLTIRWSF